MQYSQNACCFCDLRFCVFIKPLSKKGRHIALLMCITPQTVSIHFLCRSCWYWKEIIFFFMILNISIYKKTDIYSHTHISTLMNNYLNVFFNALWLLAYIEKKITRKKYRFIIRTFRSSWVFAMMYAAHNA